MTLRDSIVTGVAFFSLIGIYTTVLLTFRAWNRYQVVIRWGNTLPRRMNASNACCNLLQLSIIVTSLSVMITTSLLIPPEDREPWSLLLLAVCAFLGWGISILLARRMYRHQEAMDKVLSELIKEETS